MTDEPQRWWRRLFKTAPYPEPAQEDRYADLVSFLYGGSGYTVGLNQTQPGQSTERLEHNFQAYTHGIFKQSGPVAAAMNVRLRVFSQLRFLFQELNNGRPGDFTDSEALRPLRAPWPGATSRSLLARIIQHADLAGNAYVLRRRVITTPEVFGPYQPSSTLAVLRPDWVSIVLEGEPGDPEGYVRGYLYEPGGPGSGRRVEEYEPDEVAHFAPLPDPVMRWRGMSWLTPIIRNVQAHHSATEHKLSFLDNGATPNMIVKFDPTVSQDAVKVFRTMFEESNTGDANAFRTLFLGGGADATVVGSSLQEMTFAETQDAEEAIVAANAGVPLAILQLGEGLQGSTLNAGNIDAVKRIFQETTVEDLAGAASEAFGSIIRVPAGKRLWHDVRDVPFFRADAGASADVRGKDASTMRQLIDAGWDPESVREAITADDWTLLKHTGLTSVQLQADAQNIEQPAAAGTMSDDEEGTNE